MMRTAFVAFALACAALASACNDASLSGDTSRQINKAAPATPSSSAPGASTTAPTISQPTTTLPGSTPITDNGSSAGNNPVTGTDTGTGTGTSPGLGSLFDILGGLIKQLTEVQIDQPNQNEVIFGGAKTFHIGDGEFSPTSECSSEIHSYNLKGTRYVFEFEVLADATTVDVSIGKVCGIDYNGSNSIFLQGTDGVTNLDQKPLSKGQSSAAFTTQQLNKGLYTIMVESRATGAENPEQPSDHDDYIVGLVHVKGNKPIKPGKVGARP